MIQPSAQTHSFQERRGMIARLIHRRTPYQQRHGYVLQRTEFRQQVVELVDEAQRAVTQLAARRIPELAHVLPADVHGPRRG